MEHYLDAPGGLKLPVSKQVIDLIQELGTPCKKVDKPNPFIDGGYEYYYYQDSDGSFRTSITKVEQTKKRPKALQSQGA